MNILRTLVRLFLVKPQPKPIITGEPEKTIRDFQIELKALCETMVATQRFSMEDAERYEKLRFEIYKRGGTPETSITSTRQK